MTKMTVTAEDLGSGNLSQWHCKQRNRCRVRTPTAAAAAHLPLRSMVEHVRRPELQLQLSLYKILFYLKSFIVEVYYPLTPPPFLQRLPYCNTIARLLRKIRFPTDPPLHAIHHTLLVLAILCKGQVTTTVTKLCV